MRNWEPFYIVAESAHSHQRYLRATHQYQLLMLQLPLGLYSGISLWFFISIFIMMNDSIFMCLMGIYISSHSLSNFIWLSMLSYKSSLHILDTVLYHTHNFLLFLPLFWGLFFFIHSQHSRLYASMYWIGTKRSLAPSSTLSLLA